MEFHSILVPVAGTDADEEAIELACRLAKNGSDAHIFAVHVISIDRSLPLDAEVDTEITKAEKILARAEETGRCYDCKVETDLLQAREVAPAIVDEAVERGADLILLGVNYRTRFGEFCMSDVVPHILGNSPCRVIIHQKRTELLES